MELKLLMEHTYSTSHSPSTVHSHSATFRAARTGLVFDFGIVIFDHSTFMAPSRSYRTDFAQSHPQWNDMTTKQLELVTTGAKFVTQIDKFGPQAIRPWGSSCPSFTTLSPTSRT